MTTLLHVSDTHLGYEVYGSAEREHDFLDAFEQALQLALDRDVDGVVHTGDVTHGMGWMEPLPERIVHRLEELASAGIPFCYVLGNHDLTDADAPQQWALDLEADGLAVHLDGTPTVVGEVALYGADYHDEDWWETPDLRFYSPEEDRPTVLCLHQDLRPFAPPDRGEYDLATLLAEVAVDFDAVAMGHRHDPLYREIDGTPAFYSGATERLTRADADRTPVVHTITVGDGDVTRRPHELDVRPFSSFVVVPADDAEDGARIPANAIPDVDGHVVDAVVTDGGDPAAVERAFLDAGALDARADAVEYDGELPSAGVYSGPFPEALDATSADTAQGDEGVDVSATDGLTGPTSGSDGATGSTVAGTDDGILTETEDPAVAPGSEATDAGADDEGTAVERGRNVSGPALLEAAEDRTEALLRFESRVEGGGSCAYGFDPDEWEATFEREAMVSEPWTCPHDATDGSEYCSLHRPPGERPGEAVVEKLVSGSTDGGRERKQFVGARLRSLDLRYRLVETPDNYPIDLRHAVVTGPLHLANATVDARLDLSGAHVGYLNAEGATLREFDAARAVVSGEGTSRDVVVDLEGATVEEALAAPGVRVEGAARLRDADVHGPLTLDRATVEGGLRLDGGTFQGSASLRNLAVGGYLRCRDGTFEAFANFYDVTVPDQAVFLRATFAESAYFQDATFEDEAVFVGARFGPAPSKFRGATFGDRANFAGATFEGTVRFSDDDSGHSGDYDPPEFRGPAWFTRVTFGERAVFTGAEFASSADFDRTEFSSDADFSGGTFGDETAFTACTFDGDVRFDGTAFGADATFAESTLDRLILRPEGSQSPVVLSFSGATVAAGRVEQPPRAQLLDVEDATLGDVTVTTDGEGPVLDTLRFLGTDFEGFDFTDHRDELGPTWTVHEIAPRFDGLVEAPTTPGELEATYLKARQGADGRGDRTAAARFFVHEMRHRRRRHRREAATADRPVRRVLAGSRAVRNYVLDRTSVYGERPSRVLLLSAGALAGYAAVYLLIDAVRPAALAAPYSGVGGAATLSVESFVALVLGGADNINSGLARAVSYTESFLGAFLVALLVFALTRSANR